MPGPIGTFRRDLRWRVRRQTTRLGIETEEKNGIGPVPGNVWHKGKTVRGISLHAVCPACRVAPFDWRTVCRTVRTNGMYCGFASLVVCRQQKLAATICRHVTGIGFQRHLANRVSSARCPARYENLR